MSPMRQDERNSALWGTGNRGGDSRGSALWGKGGRRAGLTLISALVAVMLVPWSAATASSSTKSSVNPSVNPSGAFIPDTLLSQAQSGQDQTFRVIVQGDGSASADDLAHQIGDWAAHADKNLTDAAAKAANDLQKAQDQAAKAGPKANQAQAQAVAKAVKAAVTSKPADKAAAAQAKAGALSAQLAAKNAQIATTQASAQVDASNQAFTQAGNQIVQNQVKDEFSSITGVAVTLSGRQIAQLIAHSQDGGLLSITPDASVAVSGPTPPLPPAPPAPDPHWSSKQLWPYESKSANLWGKDKDPNFSSTMPSIAIVDSGIQSDRLDFGNRVIASVNLSSLPNNSPGDGRGHGTFVAGIAADGISGITGADPAANLVSIDTMDDSGMGLTSDIIKACQWILDNKDTYNIKVANFSLHSSITAPFYIDPLDRAVEQLWFHGITVVVAAGNYGTSADTPSGVLYSPGDDPFVITVGAADLNGSADPKKASLAPWSAWGYTIDGFAKPELSAPGRYMIGPVPANSTLVTERPDNVTSPGYMQLSGTSFAAPVVAGAAANILAAHPNFTPDQVKGALMLTAKGLQKLGGAGGVGVVQAEDAVKLNNPPNPNLVLDSFVVPPAGGSSSVSFDAASWNSAAQASASWNSASWDSASWNSASWNSASWDSASWDSASWDSASWNSASWNSASWNSDSQNDASKEDAAEGDAAAQPDAFMMSPDDLAALLTDPNNDVDPSTLPPDLLAAATATATVAPATVTTATTTTVTTTVPAATVTTPAVVPTLTTAAQPTPTATLP